LEELKRRDLEPFARLGNEAGAIMIGHGIYPQIDAPDVPSTLSYRITTQVLREVAGFKGLAMTDDMEMHAVSDLGSYESLAEQALLAGSDVVMFCSHIERIPDIQRFLEQKVRVDSAFRARVEEASGRAERYRRHVARLRQNAPGPVATFQQLIDEATRFVETFTSTRHPHDIVVPDIERRKDSRTPGKGRTGREEWT
jgi:beta-N-acetylhexosaminidase